MRTFTIIDDVFKSEPLFVVDCSHAQMAAYLKKRFNADIEPAPEDAVCGQYLTFNGAPYRVVWVERLTRKTLPNMIHELFHLVTRICADKGIPIVAHHPNGSNGDESAAYLLEYFVSRVFGLQVVACGTSKARFCGMGGQVVPTSWRRSWIRCPDCARKFRIARGRRFPTHVMNPKEAA